MSVDTNQEILQLKAENLLYKKRIEQYRVLHNVIACISQIHIAVYDIDLVSGYYAEVEVNTEVPRFSSTCGQFNDTLPKILKAVVHPDYHASLTEFLDLTTVAQRLKGKIFTSFEYKNHNGRWRQATLIGKDKDPEGNILNILYLTSNIDDQKVLELEQKAALEAANADKDEYLEKLLRERQEKETYYFKSRIDPMTSLYSKNIFFEEAQSYLDSNRHHNTALIFIDIDDFKKVNDTLGHLKGDEVIKEIAQVLQSAVASKDLICRYGGDEFCILMKNIPLAALVDKMDLLVEKLNFPVSNNHFTKNISCSIGAVFAGARAEGFNIKDLIEAADKEAYCSKKNGKNQYTLFKI